MKKGGAPAVRLVAGSELIDRDGPYLWLDNHAGGFRSRGDLISPRNRVGGLCDDLPSKSNRYWALRLHSSEYRGPRAN
jgi:hypothetical protein